MRSKLYLLDTHALILWAAPGGAHDGMVDFLDREAAQGRLMASTISFWETALQVKKQRIVISDIHTWKDELIANAPVKFIDPTPGDMIDSTLLPDHHRDPFDRILIAQAHSHGATIVTQDGLIKKYRVKTIWK